MPTRHCPSVCETVLAALPHVLSLGHAGELLESRFLHTPYGSRSAGHSTRHGTQSVSPGTHSSQKDRLYLRKRLLGDAVHGDNRPALFISSAPACAKSSSFLVLSFEDWNHTAFWEGGYRHHVCKGHSCDCELIGFIFIALGL